MVFGFNEDVEYKGIRLHVQSEVNRDSVLCIQLFQKGVLLHVEKVPSLDIQWNDELSELQSLIRELLWKYHSEFVAKLKDGSDIRLHLDTSLTELDSALIDTILIEPVIKKRAITHANSNYTRGLLSQSTAPRAQRVAELVLLNGRHQ